MIGYPSLGAALLQGLITATVMILPWLAISFGGKLKVTAVEVPLILVTFPAFTIVTVAVFWPFEGEWLGLVLGPFEPFRMLVVGGVAVTIGMAVTQRKGLVRRGGSEAVVRLGAAFLIGAVWGAVWGFSGWFLQNYGMVGNG
jgi:hypothetical protein